MPRKSAGRGKSKQFKKNYKHSAKKNFRKPFGKAAFDKKKQHKNTDEFSNVQKFKHIQRSKESEEMLRRQKELEVKIQKQRLEHLKNEQDLESSTSEEEIDPMDQLLGSFQTHKTHMKKRSAIDSSESSSEEELNESHDDVDIDDEMVEEEQTDSDEDMVQSDEKDEDDQITKHENKKSKNTKEDVANDLNTVDSDNETEEEFDEEMENTETKSGSSKDMFSIHLDNELSPELLECINTNAHTKTYNIEWSKLGRIQVDIPKVPVKEDSTAGKKNALNLLDKDVVYASEGTVPQKIDYKNINLNDLQIKRQIQQHMTEANKKNIETTQSETIFTSLQCELFSIVNNYQDLYYPHRTLQNGEEIRYIYCVHALNHILKTRTKILHHNAKLGKSSASKTSSAIIPEHYQDQGLFRPKIMIIVPFREAALRVVNTLISLIFPQLGVSVMNYKKFQDEFGGETLYFPKRNPKPEDYEQTFAGNTDDMFRLGICLTRKCLKLYSSFYASDIIISSPLGLRSIVGAPGDKERDYDFLASIELLILDQADIFLAQNWDHLVHVLDHFHLQPQSARDTDFSRVRPWCLNGWSRFYRQTLLFCSHELPEFRSLFNSKCSNYRGKVRIKNPITGGSIRHVAVSIPQTFQRIEVSSIQSSFDQRFNYFVNHILPQCRGPLMSHCLIFVPSYFDFVRIRNYFKKESINFVQICEYTKDAKIARSRDMFFHGSAHFLLYSERAHFFRRIRIKGIRHIVMYQPPVWPQFYSEMVNLMQEANQNPRDGGDNSMSVTVMYTKYDMLQVASIVGSDRTEKMIQSEKSTHMFMTGD